MPPISTVPTLLLHLSLFLSSISAHPFIASPHPRNNKNANNFAPLISNPQSTADPPPHIRPRDNPPSDLTLLYITSWQPIAPSPTATTALLSLLTSLETYLFTLSPSLDSTLTPDSKPLSLLYGSIGITLSLHTSPSPSPSPPTRKRQSIPSYTRLSTPQKIKLILRELGKEYVKGFLGAGRFFWDWGGGYLLAVRVMMRFGPPGVLVGDGRGLLFGGVGAFRQRHVIVF